jgi:uncharacterized protein YqjF (DUF2071 family)
MNRQKFLSAEWKKLIMANYETDPSVLKKYLPAKTELDTWNGRHFISLVGFMFLNTKVRGIRIPFHSDFPEVNLRFYVKYRSGNEWKRGVVFINEFVPRPAITFVANSLFKEKYVTFKMKHSWEMGEKHSVAYYWTKKSEWNKLEVIASSTPFELQTGSKEEFITEHYWGYSKIDEDITGEYNVEHPRWEMYPVEQYNIACNFSECYGDEFNFLNTASPVSVFLAEGSAISVYAKKIL